MSEKLDKFSSEKYITVETYRKNGEAIKTPMWFVISDDSLCVVTREKTGKVKRIKNNPDVRIAPSTFSGKAVGDWLTGKARFVVGEEAKKAIKLRNKKYGFMAKMAEFLSASKGELVVFCIELD